MIKRFRLYRTAVASYSSAERPCPLLFALFQDCYATPESLLPNLMACVPMPNLGTSNNTLMLRRYSQNGLQLKWVRVRRLAIGSSNTMQA